MTQKDWQNLMRDIPASSSHGQLVAPVPQQFPPLQEHEGKEVEHPQPGDLSSHLQDPDRGANLSYLGHNTAKLLLQFFLFCFVYL